jgi:hypothetical protein
MHYCTRVVKRKQKKKFSSLLECHSSKSLIEIIYTVRRSVKTRTIEPRPVDART